MSHKKFHNLTTAKDNQTLLGTFVQILTNICEILHKNSTRLLRKWQKLRDYFFLQCISQLITNNCMLTIGKLVERHYCC